VTGSPRLKKQEQYEAIKEKIRKIFRQEKNDGNSITTTQLAARFGVNRGFVLNALKATGDL